MKSEVRLKSEQLAKENIVKNVSRDQYNKEPIRKRSVSAAINPEEIRKTVDFLKRYLEIPS